MIINLHQLFLDERLKNISAISQSQTISNLSNEWIKEVSAFKYVFNYDWLGRPIIQMGNDMVAVQEAIWQTQPDLIIETGIAHGGSLVFHASLLALLDMCDAAAKGYMINPRQPKRRVLGIDIDIRTHNREAIEGHPLSAYIEMFEGSSIDTSMIEKVYSFSKNFQRIMLILDSNHTEEHVLAELEGYSNLVSSGSYCIVFDTAIENMPDGFYNDRPWGKGDNPLSAVKKFLAHRHDFHVDHKLDDKILIGNAPGGFLRRTESS